MFRALSIAVGLWLLAGCDTVSIDKPIGEPFSKKEKASLIGSWDTEDGSVVEVRKNKSGDLVVGSLSWDEKENKFTAESNGITLTTIGQSKYLFIKFEDSLVFCRYVRKDESNIELTLADPKAFRKVVQESTAAPAADSSKAIGVVETEDSNFSVKLSSESKALLEFFESPKIEACFDNKVILKYTRIHK